jgi:hypothetical protein
VALSWPAGLRREPRPARAACGGRGGGLRAVPELCGCDAGQPGGLARQGRIGAAQLGTDHPQRPAVRAAEDGVHVVFPALSESPRRQLGHEFAAGGVRPGEVPGIHRFRHVLLQDGVNSNSPIE